MNTSLSVLALSAILVAGVAMTPSYAQESLGVMTDKDSYSDGETVMVTGQVGQIIRGYPIAMEVLAPNGNRVGVDQIQVAGDGTFSTEIAAGGGLWKSAGEYTVKVSYGEGGGMTTATTTFMFGGSDGSGSSMIEPPPPQPPGGMVDPAPGSMLPPGSPTYAIEDSEFSVGYAITGGSLVGIVPDEASNSIVIDINAVDDGNLVIDFPREVLDARLGEDMCSGGDDDFIVLVDLEERSFEESATDSLRSLSIDFEAGASQIEVIGTCVIPEFGTVAVMILAVAVVAIVAMTARSRLSILPGRY